MQLLNNYIEITVKGRCFLRLFFYYIGNCSHREQFCLYQETPTAPKNGGRGLKIVRFFLISGTEASVPLFTLCKIPGYKVKRLYVPIKRYIFLEFYYMKTVDEIVLLLLFAEKNPYEKQKSI